MISADVTGDDALQPLRDGHRGTAHGWQPAGPASPGLPGPAGLAGEPPMTAIGGRDGRRQTFRPRELARREEATA